MDSCRSPSTWVLASAGTALCVRACVRACVRVPVHEKQSSNLSKILAYSIESYVVHKNKQTSPGGWVERHALDSGIHET